MKEVLIVLPTDALGGAEQLLKEISKVFISEKYRVNVIFLGPATEHMWNDMLQHDLFSYNYPKSKNKLIAIMQALLVIFSYRKKKLEYIFTSHVITTGLIGGMVRAGLLQKKFFVGRESTSIFERFRGLKLISYRLMYSLGYSSLDLLICQTDFMKEQLVRALPWINEKVNVQVIKNPINVRSIVIDHSDQDLVELYGHYIVAAGRLIPEKGFDILIRAFKEIKNSYGNLNLIILGEGREKARLASTVEELDLQESVFFPGFVENVYNYFDKAELCVVSSRVEGFPNVLLQMMSQNVKVASTACAGGIESIQGVYIAIPDDVKSLEIAMKDALQSKRQDRKGIYDAEIQSRSIEGFLEKIEAGLG